MDKWGLVFAGGGGKGAYEVGAWQAIKEMGIPIRAVSGASVGALNGALFATQMLELGENVWQEQVSKDIILTPKTMSKNELDQIIEEKIRKPKTKDEIVGAVGNVLPSGVAISLLKNIMDKYLSEGYFSRQGLETIISQNDIYKRFMKTDIACYAACFNVSKHKEEYICLNDCDETKFVKTLLASSAIPIIFPTENIGKYEYVDGGIPFWGDNVPIQPLCEYEKCNKILIINLEERKNIVTSTLTKSVLLKQGMNIPKAKAAIIGAKLGGACLITVPPIAVPVVSAILIKQVAKEIKKMYQYKDIKMYANYPSQSLGNLMNGTLNFEKDSIRNKIELGYTDTKSYLTKILAQEEN